LDDFYVQIGSTNQGMLLVRFYEGEQLLTEQPMAVNL